MSRFIGLLFFILGSTSLFADVEVELDRSKINLGETVNLIIHEDTSTNSASMPDLTPLQKDFTILGTERSMKYILDNGQANSQSQWTILLSPKHSGKLEIPAITLGKQTTNPLTLEVSNSGNPNGIDTKAPAAPNAELFMQTAVDMKDAFVNQQIIYTVKIFNSQRLLDADYDAPQVEDGLMVPLGSTKRYQTVQNNQVYAVQELQYAIFPQKSGKFTIKSPQFTGLIYDSVPHRVLAEDKDTQLQIKPMPAAYTGRNWLPSKQVTLTEDYDNPGLSLEQGSTLTKTITFKSVGTPAQLLPNLDFTESKGFNVYPEKGSEHNRAKEGDLIGSKTIKVTYLFNQAGKITIPPVKVKWFNIQTQQEEEALLPPHVLTIIPGKSKGNTQQTFNNTTDNFSSVNEPEPKSIPKQNLSSWGWWMAGFFALIWLITLAIWRFPGRLNREHKNALKQAMVGLEEACKNKNPEEVKEAIIIWARLNWPKAQILNLTDVTKQLRDSQLLKQMNQLNQILYGGSRSNHWDAQEMLKRIKMMKKYLGTRKKKAALPNLNPN